MKPDQAKKIKRDPKQTSQWKLLLIEARLSRQLHYMKLNRRQPKQCGQLEDRGKGLTKSNRTSQPTNQVNQITADKRPDSQTTANLNTSDQTATDQNAIDHNAVDQTTADRPLTNVSAQSNGTGTFRRSINSRLNNATIDEMINEIQQQIIAHVNSQPFYAEQQLNRRRAEQQENEIICRICFLPTSERYQPCRCDGTMRYIHRRCLSDWIQTNRSRTCNICYAKYTGLSIIYHYPPASRWLTNDLFAAKQMICFLFLIATSFALYSRRALEFYASRIRSYREQANLERLGNYFATLKTLSDRNLQAKFDENSSFDKERFRSGLRVSRLFGQINGTSRTGHLATANMSTSKFYRHGLSNLTGEAVCRVCEAVNHLNGTVANALSGVGKEIARQITCNQLPSNLSQNHRHPSGHTACNLQSTHRLASSAFCQGNPSSQPASEAFDVYGYHLANDDQLDEQFAPWLNAFSWHLLVYLVFDLIQIAIYAVVCLLFVRYFVRQWLIWRHKNRSAEVVFDQRNHPSQLIDANQPD